MVLGANGDGEFGTGNKVNSDVPDPGGRQVTSALCSGDLRGYGTAAPPLRQLRLLDQGGRGILRSRTR